MFLSKRTLFDVANGNKFVKAYSYAMLWKIKLSLIFLDTAGSGVCTGLIILGGGNLFFNLYAVGLS